MAHLCTAIFVFMNNVSHLRTLFQGVGGCGDNVGCVGRISLPDANSIGGNV